ncbi:hypothetical protein [uncultured Arthrobacter sp.]|nr:hypothetical protein [uncultured Arthrobacter sp.]
MRPATKYRPAGKLRFRRTDSDVGPGHYNRSCGHLPRHGRDGRRE